jgi:hypothetical protein
VYSRVCNCHAGLLCYRSSAIETDVTIHLQVILNLCRDTLIQLPDSRCTSVISIRRLPRIYKVIGYYLIACASGNVDMIPVTVGPAE